MCVAIQSTNKRNLSRDDLVMAKKRENVTKKLDFYQVQHKIIP